MRNICAIFLALPLLLVGCVKGGDIASLPITLSLPTTPQIVDGGGSLTFVVEISNDFGADGVKWTLTGPGSLTYPSSPVVSSAKWEAYYNAPANVATTTAATLTATSVADPSKSAQLTSRSTPRSCSRRPHQPRCLALPLHMRCQVLVAADHSRMP